MSVDETKLPNTDLQKRIHEIIFSYWPVTMLPGRHEALAEELTQAFRNAQQPEDATHGAEDVIADYVNRALSAEREVAVLQGELAEARRTSQANGRTQHFESTDEGLVRGRPSSKEGYLTVTFTEDGGVLKLRLSDASRISLAQELGYGA